MKFNDIVLLSDLDGTLFNDNITVSKENKRAIRYFVENGGKFAVATGRTHINAISLLDDVAINIPSIFSNGGIIYDIKNKEILVESVIESKAKWLILDYIKEVIAKLPNVMIMMYTSNSNFIVSDKKRVHKDILNLHLPYNFANIEEIKDKAFIKILFSGKQDEFKRLEEMVIEHKLDKYVSSVYSGDIYFELVKKDISKGTMISVLKDIINIKSKVYAVGDYDNDIDLIKYADVGIAVNNALEDLKQIADVITVSNNENAIADIIYNIIK